MIIYIFFLAFFYKEGTLSELVPVFLNCILLTQGKLFITQTYLSEVLNLTERDYVDITHKSILFFIN